jgi:hypothetical protein
MDLVIYAMVVLLAILVGAWIVALVQAWRGGR